MSNTVNVQLTQTTEPPQPQAGDWLLYWFDGEADYDDMTVHQKGKSKMVEITGRGTNEVRGLVIVTLWHKMTDMMLSKLDRLETPTMMIYGEGSIYELARCRGKWEGPILAPWERKRIEVPYVLNLPAPLSQSYQSRIVALCAELEALGCKVNIDIQQKVQE